MSGYKVGDAVRVVNRELGAHGRVGEVVEVLSDGLLRVEFIFGHMRLEPSELELIGTPAPDPVSHPPHYTAHPSGVECIQVTEHMSFLLGNTIKYIWRADLKQDAIEDLKKARWYLDREIQKRETA